MKIKIKIMDLLDCTKPLTQLGEAKGLDINIAFDIINNIDTINEPLDKANKTINKIFNDYVSKDDEGKIIKNEDNTPSFTEENEIKYNKELTKFLNREVSIDITRIPVSSINSLGLSAFELKPIKFMLYNSSTSK